MKDDRAINERLAAIGCTSCTYVKFTLSDNGDSFTMKGWEPVKHPGTNACIDCKFQRVLHGNNRCLAVLEYYHLAEPWGECHKINKDGLCWRFDRKLSWWRRLLKWDVT